MVVRLSENDVDVITEALRHFVTSLAVSARPLCTSYSAEGIELCCRRLEAEYLVAELENGRRALRVEHAKPEGAFQHARRERAA